MEVTAKIKKTKEIIQYVDSEGQETAEHEITLLIGLSRREYLELARASIHGETLRVSIVRTQREMAIESL